MQTKSDSSTVKRIALYGGAFDPVHNAHLEVARRAVRQAHLDQLIFIPSAQSPLKTHKPHVSDAERLQMLDLVAREDAAFCVDPFEIEKGGVSYSFETVRHFQSAYPGAELFWIIGADQFEQLADWKRIEALAAAVQFLVFARPGYQRVEPGIAGLNYCLLEAPLMAESSSEIRQRCLAGEPITTYLPKAVEAFILSRGLYSKR